MFDISILILNFLVLSTHNICTRMPDSEQLAYLL